MSVLEICEQERTLLWLFAVVVISSVGSCCENKYLAGNPGDGDGQLGRAVRSVPLGLAQDSM